MSSTKSEYNIYNFLGFYYLSHNRKHDEYPERQKFIGKFFHLPDNVKYKAGFFLMVSESTSNSSLKKLKISKSKERMF